MTIVSALKALAKKVTGQDIGGETVDETLEAFAAKYTTGGGNLPAVTADDNGDVLTVSGGVWTNAAPVAELPAVTADDNGDILVVSSGAWAKADALADISPLVVTGTVDGSTVTITTALADIKAAFDAGRMVFLDADNVRYTITGCVEDDGQVAATFDVTFYSADESAVIQMHVEFENALTGTLAATELATATP